MTDALEPLVLEYSLDKGYFHAGIQLTWRWGVLKLC